MALTQDPHHKLLSLIDERLKRTAKLTMLTHRSQQCRDDTLVQIKKEIKEEEDQIAQLNAQVEATADKIIQYPLAFNLDRALSLIGQSLSRSQNSLPDILIHAIRNTDNDIQIIGEDCKRACKLLEQEDVPSPYARAVLYLFCAEVFRSGRSYEKAELLTNCALDNIFFTDPHLAVIAYLIQGNVNKRPSPSKANDAYHQALSQLEALSDREKGLGYPQKEDSIKELRKGVERQVAELEKVISKGSQQVHYQRLGSNVRCYGFCHTKESLEIVSLPILGKIAAGEPINHQVVEGWLKLPESHAHGANFVLHVQGHSMIDAGIHDGDYALMMDLVRKPPADYSDLHHTVVAVEISGRDDEATLKRLDCEGYDYLVLWPENDTETVRVIIRHSGVDEEKLEEQLRKKKKLSSNVAIEFIRRSSVNDVRIRAKMVGRFDPQTRRITKLP